MAMAEYFSLNKRSNEIMTRSIRITQLVLLSLFLSHVNIVEAFTTVPNVRKSESNGRCFATRSALNMYLPSSTPLSTKSLISDKRTVTTPFKKDKSNGGGKAWQYSSSDSSRGGAASAIARSDVLPSFRAAHGLLHPHTVMRLEEATSSSRIKNTAAVNYFLETYKEFGPMACLPILSDPEVLPELTEAMRGIAKI
jgi:hypothetical protein